MAAFEAVSNTPMQTARVPPDAQPAPHLTTQHALKTPLLSSPTQLPSSLFVVNPYLAIKSAQFVWTRNIGSVRLLGLIHAA